MSRGEDGQAVLEFLCGAVLVTLSLAGTTWVIRAEWQRVQCARAAFQAAHASLRGGRIESWGARVRVREDPEGVTGEAECGAVVEKIRLKRLEFVEL